MKNLLLAVLILNLGACATVQDAKYSTMEQFGIHKRDILIDRIEATSETQEEAKQQFRSAYEELASLVDIKESGLEKKYKSMQKAVDASAVKSEQLEERIQLVDRVAQDLFQEWQSELDEYQNKKLRSISQKNLQTTKNKYAAIYQKMQKSQKSIAPVLRILQDNTLYLKHNLNARAISGLSTEVLRVEDQVALLIKQMEASISESKQFIQSMQNK